jgi:Fucosyltransferase, N-terminal
MSDSKQIRILIYQGLWDDLPVANADECGCEIWYDRSRWQEADAIVFHLPQLRVSRFPPRKLPGQFWVAWCMESEAHYPMLARRNGETKFVVEKRVIWPKDKDGNIIKPSWWVDEESCATVRAQGLGSAD